MGSTLAPSFEVLVALFLSIGIPYFLLSTTGPLFQYWYEISEKRELLGCPRSKLFLKDKKITLE